AMPDGYADEARDARDDAMALATGMGPRVRRAAAGWPTRRVLALAIEREGEPGLLPAARAELERSRHLSSFAVRAAGDRGKWENIDALLAEHPADGCDWLLVVDDDVALPRGFLDAFVFLAERFELRIAQPAHRARSHAAWRVTRRRPGTVVRQTAFVESGPLVGFHADTFRTLLPFPRLRAGWGLDTHWSAVARDRGWPIGVLDAIPVRHGVRRIATAYDRGAAVEEAREFLAHRPYVTAAEAQRTLASHRGWQR
ncbi:MAG: hypothetical protein ACRDNJ_06260, partial [Solirubrobacteraceae bacterium]